MNSKITFPRLASLVADHSGRSKRFSEDFLREFFALISELLEGGESVKVKGLGTFRLLRVEPRKSVDVTTGRPMEISGHCKVAFTPAKELAEAVNAPFDAFSAIEIGEEVDIRMLDTEQDTERDSEQDQEQVTVQAVEEISASTIEFQEAPEPEQPVESEPEPESPIESTPEPEQPLSEPESVSEQNVDLEEEKDEVPDEAEPEMTTEETEDVSENKEPETSVEVSDEVPESKPMATFEIFDNPRARFFEREKDDTDDEFFIIEESPANGSTFHRDWNHGSDYSSNPEEDRKKRWLRIVLVCVACAVFGVLLTFAVWALLTKPEFKQPQVADTEISASHSSDALAESDVTANPDTALAQLSVEEVNASESVGNLDETDDNPVPTAPSDEVVYDTIGTSRYLTTMAKAHYGNNKLWPYIYEENKDHIGHPDKIRPGTPIRIPKLSKFGINPADAADIAKANKLAAEIYARYGKTL